MARNIDVFGFDELKKAFERCEKRYPDQADALLMAQGQAVNKRTKALTPVRTKKLRNSWRLKKVKLYKGGKVRVVRIQSTAPHAHLIELGHEIVSGGRTRERGRTLNRVQRSARGIKSGGRTRERGRKLNRVQRSSRGISSGGRTRAFKMLESSVSEAGNRFESDCKKMLDNLTSEIKE